MAEETPQYAGFWIRAGAVLIDAMIFSMIASMGTLFLMACSFFFMILVGDTLDAFYESNEDIIDILDILIGLGISVTVAALLESSPLQATIGKLAVGVKVTDLDGQRLSFKRAFGRNSGKILSFMMIFIGFVIAGWTRKKQALHDIMAGTLIVKGRTI